MKSIVNELNLRQSGGRNLLDLKRNLFKNRCQEMTLSPDVDFEPVSPSPINSIDVDISGQYVLSGAKDGGVYIHDLRNSTGSPSYRCKMLEGVGRSYNQTRLENVETVQWYPYDSGSFVTSGMDKAVRIWDANEMTPVETIRFTCKIYQHSISPAPAPYGRTPLIAVTSTSNHVLLVDMKSGQKSHELRGHTSSVLCCCWSPVDPYLLVTGSCDSTIRLWDTRSARNFLASLDMKNRSPDEPRSSTDPIRAHDGFVNSICFSPNGRFLVSMGTDDCIRCWDLHTMKNNEARFKKIRNRRNKGFRFSVFGYENYNVCFIPDECSITIFEMETAKTINTLCGHYNLVNTCYFHKERMELFSGGQDRNILLWSVPFQDRDDYFNINEAERRIRGIPMGNTWTNENFITVRDSWSDEDERDMNS